MPPAVRIAPVELLVACVFVLTYNGVVIVPPLNENDPIVAVVIIAAPAIQPLPLTYNVPTPAPPVTCNALPEILDVLAAALLVIK